MIGWHCVVKVCRFRIGDRCFLGPGAKLLSSTYDYNGVYTTQMLLRVPIILSMEIS